MGTPRFDIEKLAEDYVNSNYDKFTKGDEYAALEKRYSEAGRKAADDTMGIAAARTGGLASSYAVSAGAQAYGGYMERLEDAARSLYDSQMAEKVNKLGVAQELSLQSGETAREQIHMALAAGKTIEEISDLHPEWISDSGYDTDYWNYYATAANDSDTPSVLTTEYKPRWTKEELEEYVDNRGDEYPTDLANSEYIYWTGEDAIPGYFGREYKDAYNYILQNKDNPEVVNNYIKNYYNDPDSTEEGKNTLFDIAEYFGIDLGQFQDLPDLSPMEIDYGVLPEMRFRVNK